MGTLWTPGGASSAPTPGDDLERGAGPSDHLDEAAAADQLDALREELAGADPAVVVANHCYGLFELAAVYLSVVPPRLAEAQLAIDTLALIVEGLGTRLGPAAPELVEALAQLRLAFVQLHAASEAAGAAEA
jgi:hypothetical protein